MDSISSFLKLNLAVMFCLAVVAPHVSSAEPLRAGDVGKAAVDGREKYLWAGDAIQGRVFDPRVGRNGDWVDVDIRRGSYLHAKDVALYVKEGLMSRAAILTKLGVVGLVAGAVALNPDVAAASVVRVKADGAPIPSAISSNVGTENNGFESYAGIATETSANTNQSKSTTAQ